MAWEPYVDFSIFEKFKKTLKNVYKNLNSNLQITRHLFVKPIEEQHNAKIREYGATDAYKNIVDELCHRFPKRSIYVFSYDWRQSNSDNAEKLNIAINKVLDETKKKKVDIVVHSMGGLVTSSYYSKYGNEKIDKVITCGTPYEGSAKVFNVVMNWDVLGTGMIFSIENLKDIFLGISGMDRKIKSSIYGVAQLSPTKNYISKIKMKKSFIDNNMDIYYYDKYDMSYEEYKETRNSIFKNLDYRLIDNFQNSILTNGYNNLL